MNRLAWWFRIVGAFYLLLAVLNLYGILVDVSFFAQVLPFPPESNAVQAFVDGWSPFAFELLGIATFMLWASRSPLKYLGAVWLLVWLELLHGVFADVYLISRGYNAAEYVVFIVIHLLIIATGVMFVRQAVAQAPQPAPLAAAGRA